LLLKAAQPLLGYARCVGDWLVDWARRAPDRAFLAERGADGAWRRVTYAGALDAVLRIGSALLRAHLSAERPVMILSDNGIEHGLLMLAAMHVGVPAVSVSPAYSLMSKDHAKLKDITDAVSPGLIYVADAPRFAPALAAIARRHAAIIVTGTGSDGPSSAGRSGGAGAEPVEVGAEAVEVGAEAAGAPSQLRSFASLLEQRDDAAVNRAFAAVGPDTLAKLLFTSGSTGSPKGVLNTQRMLCANQQQMLQIWPFSAAAAPVIVDWLPWSHTFGGNHNFNFVLRSGGTLYIDGGRPVPGAFGQTVANLKEIAPTLYLNVPRGFDLLAAELRADEALRRNFFSRLQLIFYAAAALPQHLWAALEELALESTGGRIALVSSWGSTETAPLATACHFRAERAGNIGLPVPGCELKLVPAAEKLEIRVRGPNVMPGYWREPELTSQAFDEEGFYRIGDAVRFVDERRPELGLYFDGRVTEDFKLTTGTWVNVGGLRIRALAALEPLVQDVVVAGHGRDCVGFLLFPNMQNCRRLCGASADWADDRVLADERVRLRIRAGLERLRREGVGSSTYASRALFLYDAPSIDAGEITDKGYINQRTVLARRAAAVERLYAGSAADGILEPEEGASHS
jgi:feruloyl-CoA synthase